jgi:probable HAF family extracellular repeat protein
MMQTERGTTQGPHRKRKKRLLIALPCAVLLALALILWLWPQPDPLYKVTILPSLGGQYTMPHSINDRGQIAGVSKRATGADHLFLWERGKGMRDLGPVVINSVHINNVGQIAGTMRDPNDQNRAFVWDPNSGRRMLPTLGGDHARACGINNLGQVIGQAETDLEVRHAFVWDTVHGIRDLTPSDTKDTRTWSINDAGQIGVFTGNGSLLFRTGQADRLTSEPSPVVGLPYINNVGEVVGFLRPAKGKIDVMVWHPDYGTKKVAQLKGTFPGAPQINDAGQVFYWQARRPRFTLFGRRFLTAPRANYLWDPQKGSITLDGCVSTDRGADLHIMDLSNHGCLVGAVPSDKASRIQGVLLEPIPERWGE